jgi:hypothetical protein
VSLLTLYSRSKAAAWWLGFGFSTVRPSQKLLQAVTLAQLGPAYLGSAWPGSWLEAGPSTALVIMLMVLPLWESFALVDPCLSELLLFRL